MVMWIVLGSLIGIVVIFLGVTTVIDKKKSKKVKLEKETLNKEIIEAGTNVSKEVIKIIKTNERNVRNFVPSVGKYKMSDINKQAKDGLKDIKNSKNFKLLKHNTDQFHVFSNHFVALLSEKSNNWSKRNEEDIKFFLEYKAPEEKVEEDDKKSSRPSKKDKKAKKAKKAPKTKDNKLAKSDKKGEKYEFTK